MAVAKSDSCRESRLARLLLPAKLQRLNEQMRACVDSSRAWALCGRLAHLSNGGRVATIVLHTIHNQVEIAFRRRRVPIEHNCAEIELVATSHNSGAIVFETDNILADVS